MAHRGLALGRLEGGLVVMVSGALPGEAVSARVTDVHRSHLVAELVQVITPSPRRVSPPCPYFGSCGGCQLQHADYEYQLDLKESVLKEALVRASVELPPQLERVGAEQLWGYRWRGEFHSTTNSDQLGFKARHGYRVVAVDRCLIHHPAINRVLEPLARANAGQAPAATLRLTAGQDGEEVLVDARPEAGSSQALVERAQPRLPQGPRLMVDSTSLQYRGRQLRVFPGAFIQVNQSLLPKLYGAVLEWLGEDLRGRRVVDAYGGMGVLGLELAERGASVSVVEANPIAARLSELHAEMYGLESRLAVVCQPLEAALAELNGADAVVLDPPRAGLTPEVKGWLGIAGPRTIVYLSCEVSALARDLHILCSTGPYRLERIRMVDMFPQTYHFEVAALLRRHGGASPDHAADVDGEADQV